MKEIKSGKDLALIYFQLKTLSEKMNSLCDLRGLVLFGSVSRILVRKYESSDITPFVQKFVHTLFE